MLKHFKWNEVELETVKSDLGRQVVVGQDMMLARVLLKKGCVVPEHSHVNEQVANVERGSLLFRIGGVDQVVGAGESLVIPPHVPHGVVALEDTVVTDVFTPRRDDWISGDDAYLRR